MPDTFSFLFLKLISRFPKEMKSLLCENLKVMQKFQSHNIVWLKCPYFFAWDSNLLKMNAFHFSAESSWQGLSLFKYVINLTAMLPLKKIF